MDLYLEVFYYIISRSIFKQGNTYVEESPYFFPPRFLSVDSE